MGVGWLLNSYVRVHEGAELQQAVAAVSDSVLRGTVQASRTLDEFVATAGAPCTPQFITAARRTLQESLTLRQIAVVGQGGAPLCDALGIPSRFAPLADTIALPALGESVSIGRLGELATPVIRLSMPVGTRTVSAFAPITTMSGADLLSGLPPTAMLRISLNDGTPLIVAGDPSGFDARATTEFLLGDAEIGDLPLRVQAAVPFGVVRAGYSALDFSLTLIACIMAGAFLLMSLQYVRRSRLPAFDLERAIAAGELKPYYQPVIDLRTGRVAGCEVLCRWERRDGNLVMPGVFMDYAELTGLTVPMTLALMRQVRVDLSELCAENPDLKIAVNLSPAHLRDTTIVDDVRTIFAGGAIAYRQLVFEIQRRRQLGATAEAVIVAFHELGARIAMDDVGTGYSNLAHMQALGIDVIKVDRSFMDMIKTDQQTVPVLDGLIAMARDIGAEIVAEGVEREEQALYLRSRGVSMAQGFLFAPALRAVAFRELARALNGPGKPVHPPKTMTAISAPAAA